MAHNDTFVVLDVLLSLLSPICLSSPLFFFSINIIIFFSFSTWYQSPNLGFLVVAPDLCIVTHVVTLHCSGGSLLAISLSQSYLSHLKLD